MGSQDRRPIVKSKYDYKVYFYDVNGKKYQRQEVVEMLLNLLDGKTMTIKEISEELNIKEQPLNNLIKTMRENNLITNTKLRRNGHYLFRAQYDCLLAQLLYPSPVEVEKQFTVKGRIARKAEQGTSKGAGYAGNVTYNNSHYDLLDW